MTKEYKQVDLARKLKEYEIKITKMAGYLSDYYIDRAIELDDFSTISSLLIDYFSGSVGKSFDVGYLLSKYKEFGLDEKIEEVDFDINEWYKLLHDREMPTEVDETADMTDEEYINYMIQKRKDQNDS